MSSKKRIFLMMLGFLMALPGWASTTKVGNGDDGRDLEGAGPITSGVIFETRKAAIEALKNLNIQAAYGLGSVIPELEHTELIMAKGDVRPLAVEKGWESSDDRQLVYARTFAEPYAPTRFFPAALKLSREQLIALHTHEALHRALPPGAREDEDTVSMLTLAITSPSATFDRVNHIAQNLLQPSAREISEKIAASSIAQMQQPPIEVPEPQKTKAQIRHTVYTSSWSGFHDMSNADRLSIEFSPLGVYKFARTPYEPTLKIEQLIVSEGPGTYAGPLSGILEVPFYWSSLFNFGPFVRMNTQALQPHNPWNRADRDVYTLGAFFKRESATRYSSFTLSYTLPSSYSIPYGFTTENVNFTHIFSLDFHRGIKMDRLAFGGAFEMHRSQGVSVSGVPQDDAPVIQPHESFWILRAGPEVSWASNRMQARFAYEWMLNESDVTLDTLGDYAGHGSGTSSFDASMTFAF